MRERYTILQHLQASEKGYDSALLTLAPGRTHLGAVTFSSAVGGRGSATVNCAVATVRYPSAAPGAAGARFWATGARGGGSAGATEGVERPAGGCCASRRPLPRAAGSGVGGPSVGGAAPPGGGVRIDREYSPGRAPAGTGTWQLAAVGDSWICSMTSVLLVGWLRLLVE
jgi:hypothetical protein